MPFSADLSNRLKSALASQSAASELQTAVQNQASDPGNTVFTTTGNVTMASGQKALVVNKASGAATTVTLPASPVTWQTALVVDGKGDAATNNITIQGATGTIDGASTAVIKTNYGDMTFVFNGTEWNLTQSNNFDGAGNLMVPGTITLTGAVTATGRITTTDGVASGTAKVVGGLAYTNTAASTAVTGASSSEQAFDVKYTIPANTLKAGTLVKLRFQGIVTAKNSTETLTIKAYIGGTGGTALISMSAQNVAANDVFQGEYELICRDAGGTGHIVGVGTYKSIPAAEGTMTIKDDILASTAIDTTAGKDITVSATWSGSSGTNSCRLDMLRVEIY